MLQLNEDDIDFRLLFITLVYYYIKQYTQSAVFVQLQHKKAKSFLWKRPILVQLAIAHVDCRMRFGSTLEKSL